MGGCKGVGMSRDDVWRALKAWVYKQEHYYVGYEFKGLSNKNLLKNTMMSESFESLVDEVYKMVKQSNR